MVWWAKEDPVLKAVREADTSDNTACQIYQRLPEVCSTKLLQTPIILGGPGVVIQLDESQFRHEPKVYIHVRFWISLTQIPFSSIIAAEGLAEIWSC